MTIVDKILPHRPGNTKTVSSGGDGNGDILKENIDRSTFSKILAIYSRDDDDDEVGKLFNMNEKDFCNFENNWTDFQNAFKQNEIDTDDGSHLDPEINNKIKTFVIGGNIVSKLTDKKYTQLRVREYHKPGESQIRGIITHDHHPEDEGDEGGEDSFTQWFIFHTLDQCRLENNCHPFSPQSIPYHELFADYFASNLKNTVRDDEWDEKGRLYFIKKVKYFTDRHLRIECILPAFPCKSSNQNKVYGVLPDKGEELALRRLIKCTKEVRNFYPPGMKIWIVSDGHVFSDCIGVDDDIVSHYTHKLHELYEKVSSSSSEDDEEDEDEEDCIGFCGLNELFFTGEATKQFDPLWVHDVELNHLTGTKICSISDVSRQIMMKGCDTDAGKLRRQVTTEGHPRLYLYRGFSRFMMEDLLLLPHFQDHSRKKFKKIIARIAFNMIKRNDAYSNLVELMFPHHIRISIHAHTNSGPKFGIKVISEDECRVINDLNDLVEPRFEDLLHIPTPWHNCVVKVEYNNGIKSLFLVKVEIIENALESGKFTGFWEETCFDKGLGGHFILKEV